MKFSIGTALLCFSLSSYLVQVSILKLSESFGGLLLKIWFWTFLFCFHGSLLLAQRCFDFHVLPILFKSQCWNISKVSVDYTCKCNAEFSLWFSMSPLNSALLCFSRASCFVQVSIMKVFKSPIDYALRNFVSNLSLFFWWKFSIGTALLWFFACFLFCSSLNIETIWEFRWTTLANVMLRFLGFSMSPLNSALLCFSRASCFVQVSIMKVFKSPIDYALRNFVSILSLFFWWKFSIGTALLWFFACFLFCSSLNIETIWEFRWTTLANVMLRFLFGFQRLH